jgi:DNA-binding transcriptional LysR family regulator
MSKSTVAEPKQTAPRRSSWAYGIELRHLRALVLLVDTGNLSAAARALGIAQSTMSEGIAALERAIGTRIVLRKRGERGVALTSAGHALLPHARTVLASLEDAHVAVAAVDRDIRTRVEVVANESISTYLLPAALRVVRKDWPNLQFVVTVGMCPDITAGLSSDRYDVGLLLQVSACPADPEAARHDVADMHTVFLSDVPLVLFAASHHPLASWKDRPALRREALADYCVFISDGRGRYFELIRDFFNGDGLPAPKLQATGSVEAVKRNVLEEHLALGVLPLYAVAEELRMKRVCVVDVAPNLPHFRLEAMAYRTHPPAHPAVAALLDALRHVVRQPVHGTRRL